MISTKRSICVHNIRKPTTRHAEATLIHCDSGYVSMAESLRDALRGCSVGILPAISRQQALWQASWRDCQYSDLRVSTIKAEILADQPVLEAKLGGWS
ncbi:hypothetical protein [Nocardia sp. XZ_19_385]|uniref:hypothetical protein n=1 Tax=Nocardia sp. XZ_19_385 TaxID=2769488 RepID=UPI00188FAC03|nr:hypothetical protein [Nocardia sp. XZ_19_385]